MTIRLSSERLRFFSAMLVILVAAVGCSNGGDGQRTENTLPLIQLDDGDVLGNGNSVVRIPATDDTGISAVTATLMQQGKLAACAADIDLELASDTLLDACLADQPTCSVEFIPTANDVVVYPPPLYAPVGLQYELSFVDRDGAATEPVTAVFCFDVGTNTAPLPAADTYQLVYPSTIQRNGVIYNSRCEKQPGSDGVLANDDDDEHVTNACLQAELVDLPRFATNLATFSSTFRSDGGFRYEGLTNAPTADSFSYRVTDGVNPPSAPVRVDIVFSGDNNPPIAVDDELSIPEDAEAQTINVLSNDSDPDALPLSVSQVVNGPASGTATIRNGVVIEYRPNADFNGNDSFDYIVVDSAGVTATATVRIQITPVNDAPMAINDDFATNENTPVSVNVVANDADLEGDDLTVVSVTNPTNGSASIEADGGVLYTPDLNFFGVDAFEYTISDGNGATDTATARIVVSFVNVAPQAVDDTYSIDEGEVIALDVLENDVDSDGDVLTLSAVSDPVNGTAEITGTSIRYTPDEGFSGTDSFAYTVTDGTVDATAQVTIIVDSVNGPPTAEDDEVTTNENTSVLIDVLENDSDPDGDELSISIVRQPRNGELSVVEGGILYTPDADFSGTDGFAYRVTDPDGLGDPASVEITVTNVNVAPNAVDDVTSTPEATAVTIDVLANDTDDVVGGLSLDAVGVAANGTAAISGNAVLYTPDDGFSGTDSFIYTIVDSGGLSDTATVTVSVTDVNAAPVAVDDIVSTEEGTAVVVAVLANDSDPDADSLSISSVTAPQDGTAVIQGATVVYTPDDGFSGTDSFDYTIEDAGGLTDTATVTVSVTDVNSPPVANDDLISTEQGDPVRFDPRANDTDPDGDPLTTVSVTQPLNGTASISTANRIIYSPNAGYSGSDSFEYTIEDSDGEQATAAVTVTVVSTNSAPVASDDADSTDEGVAVTIDVLGNDTDEDDDVLTIAIATAPQNGAAVVAGQEVVYTPAIDFVGEDTFVYSVDDGNGGTDTATVTVSVNAVNTVPVAVADTGETPVDTALSINVLANDSDADSDTLIVLSVTQPDSGVASVVDNSVLYVPATDFTGTVTFTYTISDGNGGEDTALVTIEVLSVNTNPIAVDDTAETDESTAVSINVLGNDTDAEDDSLTISSVTAPTSGTVTILSNTLVYTPADDFVGDDSFGYTVEDGNGGSDDATVIVTVNALNALPIAVDDSATTTEDLAVSIDVLANDFDPDTDDVLSVSMVSGETNGSATVIDGGVLFTPDTGFTGEGVFDYQVVDGRGGRDTATVTVTIVVSNTAPEAFDDSVLTQQATEVTVPVLENDIDADDDEIAIASVTDPSNGQAEIAADSIIYTPDLEFVGDDSFEYTINDLTGATDTATVSVTVELVAAASI